MMWNTFFDFTFDFSIVFGFIKRALTFFVIFVSMLSYSQACKPHAIVFDKLLQALTMSDLMSRVWKLWCSGRCTIFPICEKALALLCPALNLVRLFPFVFPSPPSFSLNNNALSKHVERVVSYFLFQLLVCILIGAYSFRFPFC